MRATIASVAFALFTLSGSVSAFTDSADAGLAARDNVFARSELSKRRPNHANAYGYPHNRGPHSGSGKMTPGGYKDPIKSNQGAQCKRDNQCHVDTHLAAAICDDGVCGFRCLGDSRKQGNTCVGPFVAPSCHKDWNCPKSHVAHSKSVCTAEGLCSFQCDPSYHAVGNTCQRDAFQCGREKCAPVGPGGFNTCSKSGKCVPGCETYLGYALYTNDDESEYKCINTNTDVDACGADLTVCPEPYNGKGTRTCKAGVCGISCRGFTYGGKQGGVAFCV